MRLTIVRVVPPLCAGVAVLMMAATSALAQTPDYTPTPAAAPSSPAATPASDSTSPAATPQATPSAPSQATAPAATQTAGQTPAGQLAAWTPGPGAALSPTYDGKIEAPTTGATVPSNGNFSVDGWFVDTTAQGWAGADNVQVFLGQMGNGGTMLGQGVVGESRPDVGTTLGNPYWSASGFFVQVPAASIPAGTQTLDVYVHTPGKGWWFEPLPVNVGAASSAPAASSAAAAAATAAPAPAPAVTTASGAPTVSVTDPSENQNISTRSGDHTITGNATEAGPGPSDIDRIEVWIDGERNSGTLLGTTTPASDGSWSLAFTPTKFPSTHTNIYVYAHSKSSGRETEAVRGFNIVDSTS